MWAFPVILAAIIHLPRCAAKPNCPLYGPLLPRPKDLLRDPGIQAAGKALDHVFAQYIDSDNSTGSGRFSYSVEIFSGTDDSSIWSHYWTAPNLGRFNSSGVLKVDTNTVYRIGSITKIFTVLTFLATVGDGVWNDPITKYVPEIAALARGNTGSSIFETDWDSITVGSLATQTSGIIRDYALLGELAYQLPLDDLYTMGFPSIPLTEFPPCGVSPTCNRQQLFSGLGRLPPSFPPSTTPAYSDLGFTLLGFVAESITGKSFTSLLQDAVLDPLKLKHTFYSAPEDALGVIPGNRYTTSWAYEMAEEAATGNMYTSAGDMSSLGRAILRSTLLKPAVTRRWMRPYSFNSDPKAAVGMPWGIRQISIGQSNQSYQYIHTFNKAGSLGAYSSLLAIMPELDIGYSILAAGDPPAGLAMAVADALTNTFVPALMSTARSQAKAAYSGHYQYTGSLNTTKTANSTAARLRRRFDNSTITTPLNSSLTITIDTDRPGMGVENWFSNGTDMAFIAAAIGSNISSEYFDKMKPSVRLYPAGLEEKTADGGKKVAFKAVFEDLSIPGRNEGFIGDCSSWVGVTSVVYGSRPLDLFIFVLNGDGRVTAVENPALRVVLDKVS
ncbi:beta-lactamase/transpeptidase-like protein [Lasiosphaeria hispida]|uniref:Beta-lactamase/transpeptidase-like protein n=1 Tax=Lasiosphaeria hispida TaxID=260671 RepID=A0AAJ0HQM2_9PEZI|nr:beta-lactamase/transpeptidase-like protein [Lasiosphaeria hispida]